MKQELPEAQVQRDLAKASDILTRIKEQLLAPKDIHVVGTKRIIRG